MENGHGGARPGAGRPRKSEKYAAQIAAAEDKIADRLPQLIDNMLTLADGVTVQEIDEETGGVMVYSKPPDRLANEYLINRVMGRPATENDRTALLALIMGHLDLSKLSDEQLDRLETGEDPLSVIFGG